MTMIITKHGDFTEIVIDPGNNVNCDYCNADYTDSKDSGGLTLGSYAACPKCAPDIEKSAIEFGEEHFIRYRCPPGVSYADWVRNFLRKL